MSKHEHILRERGDEYTDVVDVIVDGGLRAPAPRIPAARLRQRYSVETGTWDAMTAALLLQVVADARTIAEAARVLGLPAREIEARIRRTQGEQREARESVVMVSVGAWEEMTDELLIAVTKGMESQRSAAEALGMSRSTLNRRLTQARARRLDMEE